MSFVDRPYKHKPSFCPTLAKPVFRTICFVTSCVGWHSITRYLMPLLVVFDRNEIGNAFWEKMGFISREDLVYRNKTLAEIVRIDT